MRSWENCEDCPGNGFWSTDVRPAESGVTLIEILTMLVAMVVVAVAPMPTSTARPIQAAGVIVQGKAASAMAVTSSPPIASLRCPP